MKNSPSATVGNTMCLATSSTCPASERSAPTVYMPLDGSQPSLTENSRIIIRPIQKIGVA